MIRKTILSALLLLAVVVLVSCSKGVKAEPLIGLSYSYNGFFVDGVSLYQASDKAKLKNKEIKLGESLVIIVENLRGFTVENEEIYPACKISVTDPDGNVIMESEDIYDGQSYKKEQNNFSLTVTMGNPIVAGKEYVTTANLYDKKNPENKIDITVKSEVIE